MYGYIYKTTNLINGKIYIGQHKGKFDKNYLGSGIAIKSALIKYLKENFTVEILCVCETLEGTNVAEFQYIEEYNSMDTTIGYNLRSGGMQPGISKETKQRMSETRKGRVFSEETREKMREAKIGRVFSEESKQKMSDAAKRRQLSAEHKQKMLEGRKRYYQQKKQLEEERTDYLKSTVTNSCKIEGDVFEGYSKKANI